MVFDEHMQLPVTFIEEMKDLLKDDFDRFLASYDDKPFKAFRVNSFKKCNYDLTVFGSEKVEYAPDCFYLDDDSLGQSVFHHSGAVYIQEPSAMIPALVLNPRKKQKVLDLCASPGGKTGQLASLLGDEGLLVSNEINATRNRTLVGNVERLGLRNTVVTIMSPAEMAKNARGFFDAVLVDAPCSGEGMFRKNPDAIKEWSTAQSVSSSVTQCEVLKQGAKCVKTGGLLVYSTCTFSKRENEDVVQSLLDDGEFELLPIPSIFPVVKGESPVDLAGRLYPHLMKGEGHFVALLRRRKPIDEIASKSALANATKKESELAKPLLDSVNLQADFCVYNRSLIIPPRILPPFSKGITAYGVKVGDLDKRIIPHHQFFSAYGEFFTNRVDLAYDDVRLKRYLKGEEIDVPNANGWGVVTVEGCSLGGIKITDQRAKNHYPKGLRVNK